jgi:hypothetical protein
MSTLWWCLHVHSICVSYVRASLLAAHASLTDMLSRLLSYPTGGPPSSRHKFHRTVSLADHSYFYVTLLRVTYHSQASILSCLLQQDRHIDLTTYHGHATSRASCGAHKITLLAYADRKEKCLLGERRSRHKAIPWTAMAAAAAVAVAEWTETT